MHNYPFRGSLVGDDVTTSDLLLVWNDDRRECQRPQRRRCPGQQAERRASETRRPLVHAGRLTRSPRQHYPSNLPRWAQQMSSIRPRLRQLTSPQNWQLLAPTQQESNQAPASAWPLPESWPPTSEEPWAAGSACAPWRPTPTYQHHSQECGRLRRASIDLPTPSQPPPGTAR